MTSLEIDSAVLRGIANDLRGIAAAVPTAELVNLDDAGDAGVAAAAESFSMWAKVTGMVLAGKITALAGDADLAANKFDEVEQDVTTAALG